MRSVRARCAAEVLFPIPQPFGLIGHPRVAVGRGQGNTRQHLPQDLKSAEQDHCGTARSQDREDEGGNAVKHAFDHACGPAG